MSTAILIVKNLLFTILIPGTVAVYVPLMIASPAVPSTSWGRHSGYIPLALGVAVYLWCLWDFATYGKGTPAPIDAPKRLVVRGLYRGVRNPMYLGVLLVILGWAVHFMSIGLLQYAAAVAVGFHLFVVFYEEPALRRTFGADYDRYCIDVSRWIPRLGKRGPR